MAPESESTHENGRYSILGEKQYWDDVYEKELGNHAENPDDEGVSWFEESKAEEKIVEFLEKLSSETLSLENVLRKDDRSVRILDLGTGNGLLLHALRDDGWKSYMLGVDYSEPSIALAQQIQRARRDETYAEDETTKDPSDHIRFERWDIINEVHPEWAEDGFDVVLDKGTFDAVGLADDKLETKSLLYVRSVKTLMKPGGLFVITSCNWTESELRSFFEDDASNGAKLDYCASIKYPSFKFGGTTGQSVSGVSFRKI